MLLGSQHSAVPSIDQSQKTDQCVLGQSVTAPTPSVKQALLVLGEPLILSNREAVTAFAARRRLPTLCNLEDFVRDGGLMSCSTNFNARAADSAMTNPFNPNAQAAVQYLTWALEEIEKVDNQKAAEHARSALAALREISRPANLKA